MTTRTKALFACAVALIVILAWLGFRHERTEADDNARASSGVPVAAVVRVTRGTLGSPLVVAGAFIPFQDVDVHAKVAGYIKNIYVDVGSRVKEGQTLAVLEVPESEAATRSGVPPLGAVVFRVKTIAELLPVFPAASVS